MLVAVGDLHGDFQCVHDWLAKYDVRDTTMIQVGDVGLLRRRWPSGVERQSHAWCPKFHRLGLDLQSRNCRMYYLRGNHDDPLFWTGYQNQRRLPASLIALQDGINRIRAVRNSRDCTPAYCLGGAVSADRLLRQERGYFWHPKEGAREPVFSKNMLAPHVVITHAAPPWAPPFGDPRTNGGVAGYFQKDATLYDDVQAERERIGRIRERMCILKDSASSYRVAPASLWLYGHYHTTQRHSHDGVDYICVGKNEFIDVTQYFK